ncbi:hypothetical protein [Variovorax rhizosphaerae]|uniref:Uncharacterized protein n=1 Tax=Variovorax rhizosphaerae TaxID=1836200 RepID=A0ABU8WJ83_9BURK
MNKNKDKRPLYFISGQDFYFLAYSILLVLEFLGGSAKRVKDHRKFAYLIQFIGDDRLLGILKRHDGKSIVNPTDRELLHTSFTNAELQKREVFKILLSLERKEYIKLERTAVAEILDVALLSENLPNSFFSSKHFQKERKNAEDLKKIIQRLSILSFDSMLDRLYKERGVHVWAS